MEIFIGTAYRGEVASVMIAALSQGGCRHDPAHHDELEMENHHMKSYIQGEAADVGVPL